MNGEVEAIAAPSMRSAIASWWEIDVSYYTLKLLAWLGVVRSMREPPAWALAGQRRISELGAASPAPPAHADDGHREGGGKSTNAPASAPKAKAVPQSSAV